MKRLGVILAAVIFAVGGAAGGYFIAKSDIDRTVSETVLGAATDGMDGLNGVNGKDGVNGTNGTDGTNGIDGQTPHIGDNGNWFVGETDTGVLAAGVNGVNGVDGNQNIRQLIWQPSAFGEYKKVDDLYTAFLKEGETSLSGHMTLLPLGLFAIRSYSESWYYTDTSYLSYSSSQIDLVYYNGVPYQASFLSNYRVYANFVGYPDLSLDASERKLEFFIDSFSFEFSSYNSISGSVNHVYDYRVTDISQCPVLVTFTVADIASLEVVT
jgi:hypothetical protein